MTNRHLVHTLEQNRIKKDQKASKDQAAIAAAKEEGSQQLTYSSPHVTGSAASHPTMILMVDVQSYELWNKDRTSVPIADVVDSYDVLKYESGRSGIINKASKSELDATFGTTNVDKIIEFMLEHGHLQHKAM
jgi:hypothetical protein